MSGKDKDVLRRILKPGTARPETQNGQSASKTPGTPGPQQRAPPPDRPVSKTPTGEPAVDEPARPAAGHGTQDSVPAAPVDLPGIPASPLSSSQSPVAGSRSRDPRNEIPDPKPETQDTFVVPLPQPKARPSEPETASSVSSLQSQDTELKMPPQKNLFDSIKEKAGSLLSTAKEKWDSVKKKVRRTAIIVVSITAVVIGSVYGYGWHKEYKKEKAREKARIEAKRKLDAEEARLKKEREEERKRIILRMKNCKDESLLENLCLDKTAFELRKKGAETSEKAGELEIAGRKFARIGKHDDASRIIQECEKPKPKTQDSKPKTQDTGNRDTESKTENRQPDTSLCADRIRAELNMVADAVKAGEKEYNKRQEALEAEEDRKRAQRKKEIIARMKNCPDEKQLPKLCLDEKTWQVRRQGAITAMNAGDCITAGVTFAQIGSERDANNVVNSRQCRNNEKAVARIKKEMNMVADVQTSFTAKKPEKTDNAKPGKPKQRRSDEGF